MKSFTEDLSKEDFNSVIDGEEEIMYKPNEWGTRGIGIRVFNVDKNEEARTNLYEHIKSLPAGMIESMLKQHPYMETINPNCSNTLRVLAMREGDRLKILHAGFRTGILPEQRIDNYSAAELYAAVDITNGKVITNGITKKGESFEYHPVTGIRFKDITIPNWDKVVNTLNSAAMKIDNMPYIGWDVAIGEGENVYLIEGNHDPDAVMHQHIWEVSESKGIRDTIEQYLWFDEESRTV